MWHTKEQLEKAKERYYMVTLAVVLIIFGSVISQLEQEPSLIMSVVLLIIAGLVAVIFMHKSLRPSYFVGTDQELVIVMMIVFLLLVLGAVIGTHFRYLDFMRS